MFASHYIEDKEVCKDIAQDVLLAYWERKEDFDDILKAVSYTHLRGDLLPKSELQEAITYLRNEWNAVVDIFNYGDTYLDLSLIHI